ncbi:hypothetical protein PInf_005835 [Phytophthora infestans]|nr:hypothetical protein PInf_005835 [Phytophthora infestans]
MSKTELPLVPTARSSNSSSSSRSNLHSSSSINSERSVRSLYREEDREEEPQESSSGLWDEVEHFLNKPSPNLSNLSGKTSKVDKPPSKLPSLNGRRASPDNQATKSRASIGPKTIDPKLLQEAFAYANQLQQMSFADEDAEQQRSRNNKTKMHMQRAALGRTNSSSSLLSNGRAGRAKSSSSETRKQKAKAASSSAYSSSVKPKAVRKKRSTCTFEGSPLSVEMGSKAKSKGHMDPQTLQALVSNLQNGTRLDELRRELAVSHQSMAISRQVLQDAAQNFFQSH